MNEGKQLYLLALSNYTQRNDETSLQTAFELGKQMESLPPEEVIALHDEAMHLIIGHLESDEALKLYRQSFVFLMEFMVGYRLSKQPAEEGKSLIIEMKDLLQKSQQSFHMVKNKYETILQHMDEAVAIFDPEGYLTFANIQMSKIMNIPRRKLLGCDIRQLLVHPSLKKPERRMVRHLYRNMVILRVPYMEMATPDGRHFLVTVTYGDELEGDILISVKDVTEYKRIEQSAYQNDKLALLGKIAAAIAHEVRNPLTSIRGFVQLLKPDLDRLGKRQYGDIILGEIDRANEIINEFLNSSKPSSPDKRDVTIDDLIREVTLLSESEAMISNCELRYVPSDADLTVRIDVKQVKQVMLNILKNAMDAIQGMEGRPIPGVIQINARQTGEYVEISIRDNGMGMDEKTQLRLFEPFFTTKQKGTGLGLSVCYRIIRNHGGSIQVRSQVGQGTEFKILLPYRQPGVMRLVTGPAKNIS